jgi:3-oxoisoapionate decarboxylase
MEEKNRMPDTGNDRIDRREFLQKASAGAVALSMPHFPGKFSKGTAMGVVVHSYASRWNSKVVSKRYPAFSNAIELMEHCHSIGAGGVQVLVRDWDKAFARKVRNARETLNLYLEGSIGLPKTSGDVPMFEQEVSSAKEAGAGILRTVCLNGRRYEAFHDDAAFRGFWKNSVISLQLAEPVMRRHQMKLAIENHKDWRAKELVSVIKELDSEWIGITLDFGNSISLMEDPMEVVRALAPYAFSTHVKDMGVEQYEDGFLLSEVPLGEGFLNLSEIMAICRKHNPDIAFNLEMITRDPLEIPCLNDDYWAVFEGVAGNELARTLRMVRENTYKSKLPRISQLEDEEKLALEEQNILTSFAYARNTLGLK